MFWYHFGIVLVGRVYIAVRLLRKNILFCIAYIDNGKVNGVGAYTRIGSVHQKPV
ncbi:MAG: hypothetical protein ACI9FJ_002054 [Alteromonadaceae bacterium]|jgi:hypothetical protein